LDGGPGAKFVVDAAAEDEFFIEAAQLGGLDVEEFQFPVDDGAVWWVLEGADRRIHK